MQQKELIQHLRQHPDFNCSSACLAALLPFPPHKDTMRALQETSILTLEQMCLIINLEFQTMPDRVCTFQSKLSNETVSQYIFRLRSFIKYPPHLRTFLGIVLETKPTDTRHVVAATSIHWITHSVSLVDTSGRGSSHLFHSVPFATLDRIARTDTPVAAIALFLLDISQLHDHPAYSSMQQAKQHLVQMGQSLITSSLTR